MARGGALIVLGILLVVACTANAASTVRMNHGRDLLVYTRKSCFEPAHSNVQA